MYRKAITVNIDGRRNICGTKLREYRLSQSPKLSQRKLANHLQRHGLDIDAVVIKKIENGQRTVTDIELKVISDILGIPITTLLS